MDLELNRLVAYSLRIGVFVGASLALVGLTIWAAQGFSTPDTVNSSDIVDVLSSGFNGNPAGIAYLGMIVLIATPIFRVGLSTVYFGREKDRTYVVITLLVFGMLLFALFSRTVA